MGFPDDSVLKNLPANAGGIRDAGLIRSGRFPGGGNGNPLQYSCLGNPMDRGTWRATLKTEQLRSVLQVSHACVTDLHCGYQGSDELH